MESHNITGSMRLGFKRIAPQKHSTQQRNNTKLNELNNTENGAAMTNHNTQNVTSFRSYGLHLAVLGALALVPVIGITAQSTPASLAADAPNTAPANTEIGYAQLLQKYSAKRVDLEAGHDNNWVFPGYVDGKTLKADQHYYLFAVNSDNQVKAPHSGKWFTTTGDGADRRLIVPKQGASLFDQGSYRLVLVDQQGQLVAWAQGRVDEAINITNQPTTAAPTTPVNPTTAAPTTQANPSNPEDPAPETGMMWVEAIRDEIIKAQQEIETLNTALGKDATTTEPTTAATDSSQVNEPTPTTSNSGSNNGGSGVVYIDEYIPTGNVSSPVPIASVAGASSTNSSNGSGASTGASEEDGNANAQPNFQPDPPYERMRDLKEELRGGVEAKKEATFITLKVPNAKEGDWVFVYLYTPDPEPIGWAQVDADGNVYADLAGREAGIYKLTLQNAQGAFIGWDRVSLTDADIEEMNQGVEEATKAEPKNIAVRSSIMNTADWLMIFAALMIVQVGAFAAYAYTNKRKA